MGAALRWDHARRHPSGRPRAGESGACLVLARRAWALEANAARRARIGATAIVGPGRLGGAIARVLREERARPTAVVVAHDGTDASRARLDEALAANELDRATLVDPGEALGYGDALDACALAAAFDRVTRGDKGAALVVADAEHVGSAVLAITIDRA
jgi:hypothetical protein